ncbi:hypothetical protein VTK56DRAFT_6246 [Thermocarpiscus australiensis]
MSGKAPSAGQKVTPSNAPVTHEPTGPVPPSSLAAESARRGGAFASNPDQQQQSHHPTTTSSSGPDTGAGTGTAKATSLTLENAQKQPQPQRRQDEEAQGAPAPSYIASQYRLDLDPSGGRPHGKNLTEGGGFQGSGTTEGPLPEPGSELDPGRVAERDLRARRMVGGPGSSGDAGARERGRITGEGGYDKLGEEAA